MDTRTQPLPVVTLDPASVTDGPTVPLDRTRNRWVRPAVTIGLCVAAVVLVAMHWATILSALVVTVLVALAVLVVVALLVRLAFGASGWSGGAVLGALVTALVVRRR